MFLSLIRRACCRGIPVIALLSAASFAQAQGTPARTERVDPLDAQVRVPPAIHSSALASYRRQDDDKRIDWKVANEAVNRIGGWRAYAREAQQPGPAPAAPASRTAPAPAPASGATPAHGGHKMH